jgi:hypothetical protein
VPTSPSLLWLTPIPVVKNLTRYRATDSDSRPTDQEAGQVLHHLVTSCCQPASSCRPSSYSAPLDVRLRRIQLTQELTHRRGYTLFAYSNPHTCRNTGPNL